MKKLLLISTFVIVQFVWSLTLVPVQAETLLYKLSNEEVSTAEVVDDVDVQGELIFVRRGNQVQELPTATYRSVTLDEVESELYTAMTPAQKQTWSLRKAVNTQNSREGMADLGWLLTAFGIFAGLMLVLGILSEVPL